MVSDTIDSLNNNLDEILKKLKYIFELNIKNTWFEKNSTITLSSSKWWLREIDKNKEKLLEPIQKITNLLKWYVKNEINLQIWRLVISEKNYNSSQIKAKSIIEYLNNKLKHQYETEIQIDEKDFFSEYNIIIKLNNDKKIIIHLWLVKKENNYKESIKEHLKYIQTINSHLLLSTIDNHIQINHSLWKVTDTKNLVSYDEMNKVLNELEVLKKKLIKVNLLKDINPIFYLLQKIKIIKEISIKENIIDLLKSNNISDLENDAILTTINLIKESKMDLVEHTKIWLLPAYILWTYLRVKLILLLEWKHKN